MTAQADSASFPAALAAINAERHALRQQMRQLRRSLSLPQRRRAALQLAQQFDRHHLLQPGKHIAVYLAMSAELSLQPLIARARQRGCRLYVPHIVNAHRRTMKFLPLANKAPLQPHRWGMPQLRNAGNKSIGIRQLDLMLVPTVVFDPQGNRLGMGAGFYDRHLESLHRQSHWQRPKLVGIAYSLQQVARIPALPHDVPVHQVMTERGLIRTRPNYR